MLDLPELLTPARIVSGRMSIDCALPIDLNPSTVIRVSAFPMSSDSLRTRPLDLDIVSFPLRHAGRHRNPSNEHCRMRRSRAILPSWPPTREPKPTASRQLLARRLLRPVHGEQCHEHHPDQADRGGTQRNQDEDALEVVVLKSDSPTPRNNDAKSQRRSGACFLKVAGTRSCDSSATSPHTSATPAGPIRNPGDSVEEKSVCD